VVKLKIAMNQSGEASSPLNSFDNSANVEPSFFDPMGWTAFTANVDGGARFINGDELIPQWRASTVPPDPLIVTRSATGDTMIGTRRFPYGSLTAAVGRTQVALPTGPRAGEGWTLLIAPGDYPERLDINTAVVLRKTDEAGLVVIGR
jgi:hypothetical protein